MTKSGPPVRTGASSATDILRRSPYEPGVGLLDREAQNLSPMLASAVSSHAQGLPAHFAYGVVARPLMKRHTAPGPPSGCPHDAVGMLKVLDSAIGFPSCSTSVVDARVLDASGREEKFDRALPWIEVDLLEGASN